MPRNRDLIFLYLLNQNGANLKKYSTNFLGFLILKCFKFVYEMS